MTQVDILLRQLPESYDITVGHKRSYDIVLNKPRQSYDIYIYNLVNRQSVYGDELDPLIFHLTESTVDCLLDVSLLESALLYRYDDRTLGSLDRFPVSVLGYGGGYNYFSLKGNNISLRKTMYTALEKQISRLISNADAALIETVGVKSADLKLSVTGDITTNTAIETSELSARLSTQITSSISKVCEIILNTCGVHWFDGYLYEYDNMLLSDMYMSLPKMSLTTSCGEVYVKFSFDIQENTMSLSSSTPEFITTINLKDTIRSVMHLDADASFSYQIICSCNPLTAALASKTIGIDVGIYISPGVMNEQLTNTIMQDIRTQSALGITSRCKLNTAITDEMEAHHGFGYYDKQYLYYWDDYTLNDMGAEIVNQPQASL